MLPSRRDAGTSTFLGPDALEILPRCLQAGETWCQTLAVTGYPRLVSPGWLSPLINHPGPVDIALHVEPVPTEIAASNIKKQLARLESTRRIDEAKMSIADPQIEAAVADATELASALATGEGRLFKAGLYLTVKASSEQALESESLRVRSQSSSMLLEARPVPFRQEEGWISTLPFGIDALRLRRTFDTRALANCFPLVGSELQHDDGVLYGRNLSTGGLLFCDRFALENHNQVVLAESGKGKSYFAKLTLLRSLFRGAEVLVVDPENEYVRLAEAVGGTVVRLGGAGHRLNPLDLTSSGTPNAHLDQALFVHTVVEALVGDMSEDDKSMLDAAILDAYQRSGITSDPRSHSCRPPLLDDVVACLSSQPDSAHLVRRLRRITRGSSRGLLDQPTTVRPEGHLVVFSLKELPEELRSAATLLALESIWKRVTRGERRPRIVVVDEAWLVLRFGGRLGAGYIERLAKSARKNWCGLTTITQDVGDVLSSDLGRAVLTNASMQILLGQNPKAIDGIVDAFKLTEGEASFLLSCAQGQGLLCVGTERIPFEVIASDGEHRLAETSPAQLAQEARQ